MSNLYVVPCGEPAEETLRDVVGLAKAGGILDPVTVCGPSNYAHLSLRRRLGTGSLRLPGIGGEGLVNVRFMPLARLAELIGAPRLAKAGKRLLTEAMRAEAVRMALAELPGVFGPFQGHPSTESSLEATFKDLRDAEPSARTQLQAGGSERAKDVVALFDAFERRIANFYDDTDLLEAAAAEVRDGSDALDEIGHVILYLPREVPPAAEGFLRALAEIDKLTTILGASGDPEGDTPPERMKARLESFLTLETPAPASVPVGTALLRAPDPEEEVRAVLRQVNALLLAGTPLHRIGVLYRSARPYALLCHEQMEAAGLPHNGHDTATLAQSFSGATLLGLLRLPDAGFAREAVMEWLSGAPILRTEGGETVDAQTVDAHAWGELARAAGIVKGLDQWKARLEHHRGRLTEQRNRDAAGEDGPDTPHIRRMEANLRRTEELLAFITELGEAAQPQQITTWDAGVKWAKKTLKRYLGENRSAGWSEDEIEAHAKVMRALEDLQALSVLRPQTDATTFRRALERQLSAGGKRLGRFGNGLFVGAVKDALGMRFDHVFILGMAEGAFPPRPREDPLLTDRERATISIRRQTDRAAEERRDYLAALASARNATLCCARSDPRAGREQLPCPWYLETASALAKRPIFSRDVDGLADEDWMDAVPSFQGALLGTAQAASGPEHDLSTLLRAWCAGENLPAHPLLADAPALRAGFEAAAARKGNGFTRWDGRIPPDAALLPSSQRPISPTSLQTWAKCPFQYFMSKVLSVGETEKPEEALTLRGKDRGDLIHQALETFFSRRKGQITPDTEWTTDDRAKLWAIALELSKQFEQAGIGDKTTWKLERRRLKRELDRFLDQDQQLRKTYRLRPIALEMAFEKDGDAPEVTLDGGHTLRFRGRIDRIDIAEDGTLWVWDYKTGSLQYGGDVSKDPVDGGKLLQLPVYALAAQAKHGAGEVEARYWFVRDDPAKNTPGYRVTDEEMDRFREVLGIITGGMQAGLFPGRPGKLSNRRYENCGLCAYEACCHTDRERHWQRKRGCADLSAFVALAEGAEGA